MQSYIPTRRKTWASLLTALGLTSALAVPMLTHLTPAQASQARSAAPASSSTSEPAVALQNGRLRVAAAAPAAPAGFTCHGIVCGYEFSKSASKKLMVAGAAGSVAAVVSACNSIPGVSTTVCGFISAATGSLITAVVGEYKEGKCVFVGAWPRPVRIVDC